jgi:hypothetical protein
MQCNGEASEAAGCAGNPRLEGTEPGQQLLHCKATKCCHTVLPEVQHLHRLDAAAALTLECLGGGCHQASHQQQAQHRGGLQVQQIQQMQPAAGRSVSRTVLTVRALAANLYVCGMVWLVKSAAALSNGSRPRGGHAVERNSSAERAGARLAHACNSAAGRCI